MRAAHDSTGTSGFRTIESVKEYVPLAKIKKLEGDPNGVFQCLTLAKESELPENARAHQRYVRQAIDLKALDNVGIDLAGNKGTDSFTGSMAAPSNNLRAPPMSMAAPPNMAPPPLGFAPPPAFDGLPPPPPVDFGMPPPPPPRD